MFMPVDKRIESADVTKQAKVRLLKKNADLHPALVVTISKRFVEANPGWEKGVKVGLSIGSDEDSGKILISKIGENAIATVSKAGLGSITINFGYVAFFGNEARPPKRVEIKSISADALEIVMPAYRDDETGNGKPKAKSNKVKAEPPAPAPAPAPARETFRRAVEEPTKINPPPKYDPRPAQTPPMGNLGHLLCTHDVGIRVYEHALQFRDVVLPLNQTQAAGMAGLTKYYGGPVTAAKCVEVGFKELGVAPSAMAASLLPTSLSEILPRLREMGLAITYDRILGYKLLLK